MRIRSFADDDVAAIHAIQLQCSQAPQWRQDDYLQLARDPGGMTLVAEIEVANLPEVAGFVVFHRVMDEAELRNLAIVPLHQRKGFARALLAAGVRRLQEFGVRRIFLEVRASNHPALAFYRGAGFHLLYTRHDYYDNPVEDALVMSCALTPSTESSASHKL